MRLSRRQCCGLFIQRVLGYIFLLPLAYGVIALLVFVKRYRIRDVQKVREYFKSAVKGRTPLLICANHLSLADSLLLHWASATPLWFFFHYHRFAWNLPAVETAHANFMRRIVTYLSKCILLDRKGSQTHFDNVLNKTVWLMERGEAFCIFPEGGRSRSGRVGIERITYGVGEIIYRVPGCQVLCVYMRSPGLGFCDFPPVGSEFILRMQLIMPSSAQNGRRAHRDIALQIADKLCEMEKDFFASYESNRQ
jgi:1-acyl-sn-glycerol-3-phosphate acyltransferase